MNQTPRDAVQFTRESAERIAGVVRTIELAAPKGKPLSFESVQSPPPNTKPFRIGTFTAAWATGTQQVVTFQNQTTTPNTVSATNLLYRVEPLTPNVPQTCAIAKEGTAWYFVNTDFGGGTRKATFSGAWQKGSAKSVTLDGGIVVTAYNELYDIPAPTPAPGVCLVAYDTKSYTWRFVNAKGLAGPEVRKATFSGEWGKGATKTVNLASGGTASVTNSLYKIPAGSGSRECLVAPEGDGWNFVNEAHSCGTGKDKDSIASENEEVNENTTTFRLLLSRDSGGACMKWVEVKQMTVITSIRFEDDGTGPILKCKMCKIWVPAFGLTGSAVPIDVGTGYVDVTIPVANCSVS
jgi:hypothetical protein